MGRGVTWRDRIRYRFDRLLAHGSAAAIGWVVALAVALAVLGGIAFWIAGVSFGDRRGPLESFYQAFLIAIGRGGIVDGDWSSRAVSFVFVFAGVFLTGSLVGVLVAAVSRRIDELRRGRGRVLETGHTVILGWSPRLMSVIDELTRDDGSSHIVVLSDRDKQQMEDEFRDRASAAVRRRVAFRTGNPASTADLRRVGVDSARSVIVLSSGSFVDASAVARALTAHTVEPDDAHVVMELVNARVARSVTSSTGGSIGVVTVGDVVADVLAQAVRTAGMGAAFSQLVSFGGWELYLCDGRALAHRTFRDLVLGAVGMRVIGWVDAEGGVVVCPPASTPLPARSRLIVIADRQPDAIGLRTVDPRAPVLDLAPVADSRIVVIGWNEVAEGLLDRVGAYLPAGSRITVLADSDMLPGGLPSWSWPIGGSFVHTKHDPHQIVTMIQDSRADVVVVVGYADRMTDEEADAMTLLTLLTLERARESGRLAGARIVAQFNDHRSVGMASERCVGDFVVTDAFASRMLVHASRAPSMSRIYGELFDPDGPIMDVMQPSAGAERFGQVASACTSMEMVAIGLMRGGQASFGVDWNEPLSAGDAVLVIRRPVIADVDLIVERDDAPAAVIANGHVTVTA